MSPAAAASAVLVVAWVVLVIVAQVLNPEQSPLSMGMSGLARGHAPWVMKSAFLCRGASALLLLIAVPGVLGTGGLTLAGVAALWVWGVGSATLSVVDTDMPGEPPSRGGAAHALVALAAYVAGVVGAILLSVVIARELSGTSLAVWALPLALAAAAAMVAQFVAFGAAAREARASAPVTSPARASAATYPAASPSPAMMPSPTPAQPTAPMPLTGVAPPLTADAPAAARPAGRGSGGTAHPLSGLAGYAGVLQRVFVGLLMLWTLLVALGIGAK